MIKPYNLGEIVENVQSIKIDELVRKSREEFKLEFVKSSLNLGGKEIQLTSSKTRFDGNRIWFVCPICNKRSGTLYVKSSLVGCNTCLGLSYGKQRFKGMVENIFR